MRPGVAVNSPPPGYPITTASVPLAGEYDSGPVRRAAELLGRLGPLLALLAVVAVVGVLVLLAVRASRRAAERRRRSWVTAFVERLERAGAARGRPRGQPETPAEYSAALADSVLPDPRLVQVGTVVTRAAYSATEPEEAERRWAEEVLAALEEQFPARRTRFRMRRRPRDGSRRARPRAPRSS